MAPSLEEPVVTVAPIVAKFTVPVRAEDLAGDNKFGYQPGRTPVAQHNNYAHEDFLPSFPDIQWAPLEYTPYQDKGLRGDHKFRNLLRDATEVFDYNPKIGTEVHGVDLSKLDDAQRDDLARLIAYRGVVFFRSQKNFDIEAQRQLGQYWGKLHKHATTSVPRKPGLEDVHVVYTGDNSSDNRALFTPSFLWHSDVTYEIQPPSYTSLKILSGPPRGGGGDTLWSSQYAAYDVLSSHMQNYLKGLTAIHSADMQANDSRALGRPVRRRPVTTEHPLIRTNPVTGWNGLFFNPGFVKKIVGIPAAESDAIIRFLTDVISTTPELHARFSWDEDDVALWDNRSTNHSASYGFSPHRRHAVRVAVHAERPVLEESGKSQEDEINALYGLPAVNKDGSRQSNYND
ncbi:Alpha-ketoglutarate-dependent taurine dioxygenase [Penicillium digitatum]|uniref:Alpha-ketoglutarate-dependent taurine dioxygenase n=3 Tax=Penicillium digitatum TaxID=36651 RepID=K9G7I9_PEND2|nr:Alpha-ketoglutarate-dependent taurine dioxygenase [Penicillium digitatum Pd1]EKV15825.1 Alpha-ketoglutarate-dependent taurine dioxygenase [Penicillium digitatum Pd1]EKV17890.1 Alpha-ketoglutarate-dependent taurine dioxygenase [Penicillium digitatum PHI26]QQK42307.1 Alpha-ketoglutarate-dependent taurine dioxygenase [Penicillium digitatum]